MEERKKWILAGILGVVILAAAAFTEKQDLVLSEEGTVQRGDAGAADEQMELILNAEGLPENYNYTFTVEAALLTEEEIAACLEQAKEEIDERFFPQGEEADHVTGSVNPEETYARGMVEAEWNFDNYHRITTDGVLVDAELSEDGSLIHAEATLSCQGVTELYDFAFMAYPKTLSAQEELLNQITQAIADENSRTGSMELTLPTEVGGVKLNWSESKSHLVVKVALFEILIMILLYFYEQEQKRIRIRERREAMELDYAEVVSKLSILMGSGMSLKQAWYAIANRYLEEKEKERPAYEEMVMTMREIQDGESERIAYQRFGERSGCNCFHRLSRMLVSNLQKGSRDICSALEKEAGDAFEERKLLARKQGEEASTRMLMPLMLMMGIVIAIVIVPAIISFNF